MADGSGPGIRDGFFTSLYREDRQEREMEREIERTDDRKIKGNEKEMSKMEDDGGYFFSGQDEMSFDVLFWGFCLSCGMTLSFSRSFFLSGCFDLSYILSLQSNWRDKCQIKG